MCLGIASMLGPIPRVGTGGASLPVWLASANVRSPNYVSQHGRPRASAPLRSHLALGAGYLHVMTHTESVTPRALTSRSPQLRFPTASIAARSTSCQGVVQLRIRSAAQLTLTASHWASTQLTTCGSHHGGRRRPFEAQAPDLWLVVSNTVRRGAHSSANVAAYRGGPLRDALLRTARSLAVSFARRACIREIGFIARERLMLHNMPIDADPQQQEAASPQMLVVRSSSR